MSERQIHARIPDKLADRLDAIPWGLRSHLMRALIEKLMEKIDEHGTDVYGPLMSGEFSITFNARNSGTQEGPNEK